MSHNRRLVAFTIAATVFGNTNVGADSNCVDYKDFVGIVAFTRNVGSGVYHNGYLFSHLMDTGSGHEPDRLRITDVRDPYAPRLVFDTGVVEDTRGMAIVGDRVYMTADTGLFVFDIQDPAAPILTGNDLDIWGRAVHAELGLLCIGDDRGLDQIGFYDLTHPDLPVLISSTPGLPSVGSFHALENGHLIYTTFENGERIILLDAHDVHAPTVLDATDNAGGIVAASYPFVYRLTGSELATFDVTTGAFVGVGQLTIPIGNHRVRETMLVRGERLYIEANAVHVVDVSNPQLPFVERSLSGVDGLIHPDGDEWIIYRDGGLAVVRARAETPETYPSSSTLLRGLHDIALGDGVVYAVVLDSGVAVVDITEPSSPSQSTFIDISWATRVWVERDRMIVKQPDPFSTGSYYSFYDIGLATAPALINTLPSSVDIDELAWVEDVVYAYSAADQALHVFSATTELEPTAVSTAMPSPQFAQALTIEQVGSHLVVGGSIVSLADPLAPIVVGSIPNAYAGRVRAIDAETFWLARNTHLYLVDLREATAPLLTETLELASASSLAFADDILYEGGSDVGVIDLERPDDVRRLGTIAMEGPNFRRLAANSDVVIAMDGDALLVMAPQCGALTPVQIARFDVSAGDDRVELRWSTSSESAFAGFHILRSVNGSVFEQQTASLLQAQRSSRAYEWCDTDVASGASYTYRLLGIDLDGMQGVVAERSVALGRVGAIGNALRQNAPNPFNPSTSIPFELSTTATVTLTIYDTNGRHVRSLLTGQPLGAGRHAVRWDGSNEAGVLAASGRYFYTLTIDERTITRTLTMLR